MKVHWSQLSEENREAARVHSLRTYDRHRDEIRERQVWYRLKTRYGISREQYEAMLEAQDGVCAICKGSCKTDERLSVDHSHETGKVRGLLCRSCNMRIGVLEQSEWVESAKKYLEA